MCSLVSRSYANVLTIPAFDESVTSLQQILSKDDRDVLIILVINAPSELALDSPALHRTQQLLDSLSQNLNWKDTTHRMGWATLCKDRNIDLLCIDCATSGNRLQGGVGSARRIAADCALALIEGKRIASEWIHCTDADARLPEGYFNATAGISNRYANNTFAAAIYPFQHVSDDEVIRDLATHYELHLRYYTERLQYVGSPYGFHSLGSTLAVNANAYAAVRGFPARKGAEDFYLLNKLIKTNPVISLVEPKIQLIARRSHRVPFGTGPALERMQTLETPTSYAAACFPPLKEFFTALENQNMATPNFLEHLPEPTRNRLRKLGFEEICAKLTKQSTGKIRFRRGCLEWFDGFRLIKYLNLCRKEGLADEPLLPTTRQLYDKPHASATQLNTFLYERETHQVRTHGLDINAGHVAQEC